jgi:DNA (cytosine-5)-methyltransferase 1
MKPRFEKPTKEVSERMKKVKSKDTGLEKTIEAMLGELGLEYEKHPNLCGKPDFRIKNKKVLIFCDSSFWHGRREKEISGKAFKKNREFWTNKLIGNKRRDQRTNRSLRKEGWSVHRFWDSDILKKPNKVKNRLKRIAANEANGKLMAIDLCCGAGGLTLGLKRAGFNVVAGVEIDQEISKTYEANHPTTMVIVRDIREITGKEILELTGLEKIDLVAGCPPCQGFSSLTNKYKRKDPRNKLVTEMARIVEELRPEMVMMENVPGITHRGKRMLNKFVARLEKNGYVVNMGVLQMADYGVPQSRRRFVLLAGKGFRVEFPKKTYGNNDDGKGDLKPWLKLEDIIRNMKKPVIFSKAMQSGGPKKFNWHVVADLKKISIERLGALGEGDNRDSLPKKLRPRCHRDTNEGFINVYGRLSWNRTPPTITSGFTKPAMGRFGHPDELRTISVREAGMIQTFPKRYKFETETMKTACDLVGNALPPKFAEKAAKACLDAFFAKQVIHGEHKSGY